MPIHPDFIPLPKSKEMFAIASWRDSPLPSVTSTTAGLSSMTPSPHPCPLDSFRNGKGATGAGAVAATTTMTIGNVTATATGSPHLSTATTTENGRAKTAAAPLSASTSAVTGKTRKKRKAGSPIGAAGAASSQATDVDDFFVHVHLPPGVSVQALEFELQGQSTPLKTIEVGMPKSLLPRKVVTAGDAASAGLPVGEGRGSLPSATAQAKKDLSPFRTPAVAPGDNDHGLPPMSLPPPSLAEVEGGAMSDGGAAAAAENPAHSSSNGGALFAAPAAGAQSDGAYLISILFAEKAEAEKTMAFVQRRWPTAVASLVSRSRSILNATLVLKGMPNQAKAEFVLAEMQNLPHAPSYVRLLRSERGVFKGVLFAKYASCEVAEECKLRLEQLVLGTRPLKVEFKKKSIPVTCATGVDTESKRSLQELVRDLRVSSEHEGFHLLRNDVTKEELKVLKQLCQSYGLLFDMNDQRVTVRRVLGANGEKFSPPLRPQSTSPAWAPATPAPLRPMDFKGISHWKDIRSQANTLGILRPLGPDDGKAPFSMGRGRPL